MSFLDIRLYVSTRAHSFFRQAVSSVLLAIFLLPLFLPLSNLASDSTLPACCRRDGGHRCAMSARSRPPDLNASSGPLVRAVQPFCPYRSRLLMPLFSRVLFVPSASNFSFRAVSCQAPGLHLTILACRSEFRSHPKRGPPPFLS
jgi:hypothetical protein